jgi:hypothetical protein
VHLLSGAPEIRPKTRALGGIVLLIVHYAGFSWIFMLLV